MSNLKYVLEHTLLNENDIIALVLPTGEQVWKGFVKDANNLCEMYSFKRFVRNSPLLEGFNKPSEVLEVESLKKDYKKKPVTGEYILNTKDDVMKAIKFFNHQKPEKEEDYAHAIINKMHEFGISSDNINGDNRLCKYVDSCTADLPAEDKSQEKELTEAKIPGEHQCPNCGATLDAWDGAFCDKKCKEEYESRNKAQEKQTK